jgi:glucose-fructose oxidoreductase
MRKWRIVGVSFEHAHMGDLLREVSEHPNAAIAGIWDNDATRMADAIAAFSIPKERVYRDIAQCVQEAHPDLAILCPATARHADVVEEVAALGVDILLEKPFAASLADADRMLTAVKKSGVRLAINWPLRWYPPHVTTKRPLLTGSWFNDGFAGAMGELLCAIEDGCEPLNSARGNLLSLQLCQAAVRSVRTGGPVAV